MKKTTKIIAILFAGSLLTAGGLQAADHHGGKQCGDKMHMFKKLDLSDAQHDAIKAIKESQHASKMAQKDQMKSIREGMKKQVMSDSFNLAEVRKLANQKAQLVETMTVSMAQSMHQIYQQLTPEQRTKFAEMKDKMHQKKMKKHGQKEKHDH